MMREKVMVEFSLLDEHISSSIAPSSKAYIAKMLRMVADKIESGSTDFLLDARNEKGQRITIGSVTADDGTFSNPPEYRFTVNDLPDFRTNEPDFEKAEEKALEFYGLVTNPGKFESAYWNPREFIWREV